MRWPTNVAILLLSTAASIVQAQTVSVPRLATENVMLCDSPEHAIAFTEAVNGGAPDDVAKDIVGRSVGAEVCDKFIGRASIDEQKTLWDKGYAYTVTSYAFKGVGAMRWSAIPKDQE